MSRLWVIGDTHGHRRELERLLQDARLVDGQCRWVAGADVLVVVGDIVDRGPDGVGTIRLLMDLETQAARVGGQVEVVLGNHEVQLLAAWRFGDQPRPTGGGTFVGDWQRWGGVRTDLERLDPRHVAWLECRPTMVTVGNDLLVHADSDFYLRYGDTVADVNASIADILSRADVAAWDRMMRDLVEKRTFESETGAQRLAVLLARFGARRLVHGHTPIAAVTRRPPGSIDGPLVYAGGRAINVDHGLYLGGRGFVFDRGAIPTRAQIRRIPAYDSNGSLRRYVRHVDVGERGRGRHVGPTVWPRTLR